MEACLAAAETAFSTWRSSPRRDRQALLRRIATRICEDREDLATLMCNEIGKPISQARAEVDRASLTFQLAADLLSTSNGEVLPTDFDPRGDGYRCIVERFPLGVVFAVIPYNWPLNLAAHKIAPSLAAGNTVIVKASTKAALTTLRLVRLIHECGAPDGVVNGVACDNATAQRGIEDDRVAMLSFTGSVPVGWMLKGRIPKKRVTLELGGDASAVVTPSADLDWALPRIVAGAFGYAGQICISIQHVWVHQSRYEESRDRLIELTEACPAGDPRDEATVCGPVIDADSISRIEDWIQSAESGGAQVLAGGHRIGNVLQPTLVSDVPSGSPLACEEVFGPVLTLGSYSDDEEVIAGINQSKFGIHTGVFTTDIAQAEHYYRALNVGGVVVNDYPTLRFDNMPYGGVKLSGFGREGVLSAYLDATDPKVMLTRLI